MKKNMRSQEKNQVTGRQGGKTRGWLALILAAALAAGLAPAFGNGKTAKPGTSGANERSFAAAVFRGNPEQAPETPRGTQDEASSAAAVFPGKPGKAPGIPRGAQDEVNVPAARLRDGGASGADGNDGAATTYSDPAGCPTGLTHWGGHYYTTVAASGNHVFVGGGQALTVLDATDPTRPAIQGLVSLSAPVDGIAVDGERVYVAASGLRIIDVSDPVHPREVGAVDTPGYADGVAVSGGYAYVAEYFSGLRIIDVSDPAHPRTVGAVDTPGSARGVAMSGGYAYVADGSSGLQVIDVSDPAHPRAVGAVDTPGSAERVAVSGDYAYVADGYPGLRIIDVSDPIHPWEVGAVDTPGWASDVAVSDGHAFVTLGHSGLRVIDVSDPVQPREVGAVDTPGSASDVAVSDGYAYVSDGDSGLRVIDVSDPAEPREAGAVESFGGRAFNVAVSGRTAYLPGYQDGLQIVDIGDPSHPRKVSAVYTLWRANGVAVSGGFAYVANGDSGLAILDVSDPAQPWTIGHLYLRGWAYNVAVSGGYAFLADGFSGLRVIDVTNPAQPREVGAVDTPGDASCVAVSGDYAYVADYGSGLRIIDVSDPAHPREVGALDTAGHSKGVAVSGGVAYVADGWNGFLLIDVSDPAHPRELGALDTPGWAYGVTVSDGCAYLADNGSGLWVIDVSDPVHPVRVGGYESPVAARAVALSGPVGVLACDDAGFDLFRPCAMNPPAAPADLRAVGLCGGRIQLTWLDQSDNEFGYAIERQAEGDPAWTPVAEPLYDTGSWVDQDPIEGLRYHYRIRAFNDAGASQWSGVAGALAPRYDAVIPAAAHTAGANQTEWRTDLDLLNLGAADREVEVALLLANQANPDPATARVTVPAGQTARVADALGGLFQAGNAALGLRAGCGEVLVNARFYNTASACGGTYGMAIPAEAPARALPGDGASVACFHHLSYTPGGAAGFRTNIGFASASPFAVTVKITLYGDAGEKVGETAYPLQPYEHVQFTRIHEHLQTPAVEHGWAAVEALTPEGLVHVYAMLIDNESGDPVYLEPDILQAAGVRPDQAGQGPDGTAAAIFSGKSGRFGTSAYDRFIPAAAHTAGANQTEWRTDLDLLNVGAAEAVVNLALLRADQANPAPETAQVAVPPGRAARLEDVLGSVFQCGNAALGLGDPGGTVLANARFYNTASACGGTYGMSLASVGEEEELAGDGVSLGVFHHLGYTPGEAGGFRTNIGFVNAAGVPAEILILLYGDGGERVGATTFTLEPYEHRQFTRIHEHLGTVAVSHGHALVGVLTPGGRVHPYAMVVDNESGDPVYLPMDLARQEARRPAPQTELRAEQAGALTIRLTWQDHADNELGYRIERSFGSQSNFTFLADLDANATVYLDQNLIDETFYSYRVAAYNLWGSTPWSNTASTKAASGPPDTPSDLQARVTYKTKVELSWRSDSNRQLGFQVERALAGSGSWILRGKTSSKTWSDYSVETGQGYCYRVRAYNDLGDSGYTDEACVTIAPPAAPTGLTARGLGNEVELAWQDNSAGETGFRLERRSGPDGTWGGVGSPAANATGYFDRTATAGREYTYRVKAVNGVGESAWSNEAAAVPVACPEPVGTCLAAFDAWGVTVSGGYAYVAAYDDGLRIIDVQDPARPREVSAVDTPGYAYNVAVSDGFAYVADWDSGLRVIAVSDPAHPREVAAVDTFGHARSVAVSNEFAYVADQVSGLRIIDVHDPAHPREAGAVGAPVCAVGVAVSGGYAYVTDCQDYLRVIDVSDPVQPREVGDVDTLGYVMGVAVSDGFAYVANIESGLRVIDVSDPAHPREAGAVDTPGYAWGVAVSGGIAYVADRGSGLRVIDVSDPVHPREVGFINTPGEAYVVALSGDIAYVADWVSGLRVIDVSDPLHPVEAGALDKPGSASGVAVSGGIVYLAYDKSGLRIIDISDPAYPSEVGTADTPGSAHDVAVSGGIAYVADSSSGLRLIDVSDPAQPREVGAVDTPGSARSVAVFGGTAYVADGGSGLRVIDVSDPAHPREVGGVDTPGNAYDVAVSDGYACVADHTSGLRIIDVHDPAHPTEVGAVDTPGYARGVAVSGGYAYVAVSVYSSSEGTTGLRVIDVSDPAHPREVGAVDTPGSAYGVTVSGGTAYVADWSYGLRVIDVSDPAQPREVGFADTPGHPYDVAVSDGYALVADDTAGLAVLDLSECGTGGIASPPAPPR